MFRWLLQWLNRFLKHFFDSHQTRHLNAVKDDQVVAPPPELTNADLELLFMQLLDGVHQARGQQWALKYLQRMQHRITVDRWIDWLLMFGEKLLTSSTPNQRLATRMIQLGELQVGKIGELAYEIGIELLRQNLDPKNQEQNQVHDPEVTGTLLDTPGQELLRVLGARLWEEDWEDVSLVTAISHTESTEIINPGEDDAIYSLLELFDDDPKSRITPEIDQINSLWGTPEDEEETPTAEEMSSLWGTVEDSDIHTDAEIEQINSLLELFSEDTEKDTQAPTQESLPLVIDATERNEDQFSPVPITTSSPTSLAVNIEPKEMSTVDDLLVKLDQSNHLVQQLAAQLTIQKSHRSTMMEPISDINQAQAWFFQGLQQARTGNLSAALAAYNQAINLQPDISEYWFNRGLTLFYLQEFAEAIAAYNRAIELKPDFAKAWYNRGGILGEVGEFEAAIASFDEAIAIKPNYQAAWSSRGLGLLKLGLLWEAISSYDQALSLEPDPETWYYRGVALAVDEQFTEAIASYDQALAIAPDYQEVWIDRGVVLFNLRQWAEAITSWDRALAIQPDLYLAWYNRGIALDNLGRSQEAIASYEKAIAIKADFHVAWYNQAVALFYLERYAEAIASYDSALEIKLDYWEAWLGRGTSAGHLANLNISLSLVNTITTPNASLKLGGYEGKLASYEEGLKHLRPDTHPEGWGRLHLAIANTYYDQGKKHSTPRHYWYTSVAEYEQALLTLTPEDFPQLHLEVLQSLIKVLIGLGETASAQELQQQGRNLFAQLIQEPTLTDESKQQLGLKFASLEQFAVDLAVDIGDLVEAWEIAEQGKNTCLTWQLSSWNDQIFSPYYHAIQHLLNPTTAIIYWHISPAALHTFIIKDAAPSPILLFTPIQDVSINPELPLPEAVQRLINFENWLKDWHQQYQEYREQTHDQESKINHSWRGDMEQRLINLHNILNISTIDQELEGITQLILIPHRDLHTLPLHTLFNFSSLSPAESLNINSHCIFTYLPSVQIGINLKSELSKNWQNQKLLSLEQPDNVGYPTPKSVKLASEIVTQIFDSCQRIQGLQATKDNVEKALSGNFNVCNFTGYAINNVSQPKKSELVLAGVDKLTFQEIYQQNLANYHLVTLWACENSININHNASTEFVNLATGLLIQRVANVVSTIWFVESSATALVMIEFYRRLQPNKSAVNALAEATAWLRELTAEELKKWYEDLLSNLPPDDLRTRAYLATQLYRSSQLKPGIKPYHHPYYWTAFTISGQPILD